MVIQHRNITLDYLKTRHTTPIFLCSPVTKRVEKALKEAAYSEVKLNKELSELLLDLPKDERPLAVEKQVETLLSPHQSLFITDIEILFDPRYPIDVVKLFCKHARFSNLFVLWPGKYENGRLIYASPYDSDYHSYDCSQYQIQIIV